MQKKIIILSLLFLFILTLSLPAFSQSAYDHYKKGYAYYQEGKLNEAVQEFDKAVALFKKEGKIKEAGVLLGNIGIIYYNKAMYKQAINYFTQALEIKREEKDIAGETLLLKHIGLAYTQQGRYSQAIKTYNQSLAMAKQKPDEQEIARLTELLGDNHKETGVYNESLQNYWTSLQLNKKLKNQQAEEQIIWKIAELYAKAKFYREAFTYYELYLEAKKQRQDISAQANTLQKMAMIAVKNKDYHKALGYLQAVITNRRALKDNNGIAVVLNQIGDIYNSQQGAMEESLRYYQQALNIFQETNSTAKQIETLLNIVRIYDRKKNPDEAGKYLDQALKLAAEKKLDNPDVLWRLYFWEGLFLERNGKLKESSLIYKKAIGYMEKTKTKKHHKDKLYLYESVIYSLINLYEKQKKDKDNLFGEESFLYINKAQHYFLKQILSNGKVTENSFLNLPSLSAVQQSTNSQTAVIVYFIGGERAFLWVITDKEMIPLVLPASAVEINKTVKAFSDGIKTKSKEITEGRKLYQFLIKPAEKFITGRKNLVIIPSGTLYYLPFAALQDESNNFLVNSYLIKYLPAISLIPYLKNKTENPVSLDLAAFALGSVKIKGTVTPMLWTDKEADELAVLFPKKAVYKGPAFTEKELKEAFQKAKYVHLSSYTFLKSSNPFLSAILIGNNDHVTVRDLFEFDVNSLLISINSCQGDVSSGEDLLILSSSLFYAGAGSLVIGLWQIEGQTSTILIKEFYSNLSKGIAKDEALRQAQVKVMEKYPHPFYWANFILAGWQ